MYREYKISYRGNLEWKSSNNYIMTVGRRIRTQKKSDISSTPLPHTNFYIMYT